MTCYNLSGTISRTQDIRCELGQVHAISADIQVQHYTAGGKAYVIGHGLKLDEQTNTLSVDTAEAVEQDNTLPVTSAAVYTTVGNIEVLLGTI
nr:hypothetical protein [uncultured Gemmiger sp.]